MNLSHILNIRADAGKIPPPKIDTIMREYCGIYLEWTGMALKDLHGVEDPDM
jgi:hypothetical protein